jgi:SAM-dependent methyltransferase
VPVGVRTESQPLGDEGIRMGKRLSRPGVREGYDLWAEAYEATANPVVALDRRHTIGHLRPRKGERILDAGCGTGANLRHIVQVGGLPVGLDFSRGMLRVAQRSVPGVALAQADLDRALPVRRERFDGFLCALVSEHLRSLGTLFLEAFATLRRGGRLAFSAFHPALATAGVEANFERDGIEYRLGAEPYTVDDYLNRIYDAGFRDLRWWDYRADTSLVEEIPWASKYLGRPLLLVVEATRPDPVNGRVDPLQECA